jgi:predicted transcriptional regulator
MKSEKVANIMTSEVQTVNIENSLQDANNLFTKNQIRHLPVVSGDKLVGILSYTDILRISFGNTFDEGQGESDEAIFDMLSINQIMKHSPITVSPENSLQEAAKLLAEKEFHALPVVKNEKLVGIITTTDIIKYFLKQN